MKQVRLRQLILRKFKGMTFTINANGHDVDVFGDNKKGKTTLDDAYHWLLTDRDARFGTGIEIKGLSQDGQAEHNQEHEVVGIFDVDGQELLLRKVYKEIWKKTRGSSAPEFSGHTTDHFIDMVPVSKKEYQAKVAELATEEMIKRLTSPTYFAATLPWAERRKALLAIAGDITDDEVVATSKDLAKLKTVIGSRTVDGHRDMVKARSKEINAKLAELPARIDEATLALPDISGIDVVAESAKANAIGKEVERLQVKTAELISSGGVAEKKAELAQAEAEHSRAESAAYSAAAALVRDGEARLSAKQNTVNAIKGDNSDLSRELVNLWADWEAINNTLDKIGEEWKAVSVSRFVPAEDNGPCPHCGQEVPLDLKEQINNQARAKFDKQKKEAMDAIMTKGKPFSDSAESLAWDIEGTVLAVRAGVELLGEAIAASEIVSVEVQDLRAKAMVAKSPELTAAKAKVATIKAEIARMEENGPKEEIDRLAEAIEAHGQDLAAISARIESVNAHTKGQTRITELTTEQKRLAAEFDKCEEELSLIDRFERAKVSLLDGKINSHFQVVKWRLFEELVNGGLAQCCEAMVDGVQYSKGLNNAATIQAGMDIIATLSRHHGVSLPLFIDNAESVTTLPEIDAQVVRLIVSKPDKELRVVLANNNEMKEAA